MEKNLGKIFEKNLENKDKLMEEDIKKWRKASTLEEKEVHLKNASEKVFKGFKSIYLSLYIANEEVRNFYLEKGKHTGTGKDLNDPVLYLEKFPAEYKRMMNLSETRRGYSKGLEKIGEIIEKKAKNLKEGEKIPINYKENVKYPVKLELAGGFEWGSTTLWIKDVKGKVEKKNGEYVVNFSYTPSLFDSFEDAVDIFNIDAVKQELKNSKPYNITTKSTPVKDNFKVKNLSDISSEMRKGYEKHLDKLSIRKASKAVNYMLIR